MFVTLLAIAIDVKSLQLENAQSPTSVTVYPPSVSGMTMSPFAGSAFVTFTGPTPFVPTGL